MSDASHPRASQDPVLGYRDPYVLLRDRLLDAAEVCFEQAHREGLPLLKGMFEIIAQDLIAKAELLHTESERPR